MDEVKAAMAQENSAANYPRRSSDGGDDGDQTTKQFGHNHYQDSGHGSNDEKSESHHQRKPSGKVAVNFASAKQRQKSQITAGKTKKRGDELLTMIRLDVAKYDMFDLPPIAYEGKGYSYIEYYRKMNRISVTKVCFSDFELRSTISTRDRKTAIFFCDNYVPQ